MAKNVNLDYLLTLMINADQDSAYYYRNFARYCKVYGHEPDLTHGTTPQMKKLIELGDRADESEGIVRIIVKILCLNNDQEARLYDVRRAVKRWYEEITKWQEDIPDELIERLEKYIWG